MVRLRKLLISVLVLSRCCICATILGVMIRVDSYVLWWLVGMLRIRLSRARIVVLSAAATVVSSVCGSGPHLRGGEGVYLG